MEKLKYVCVKPHNNIIIFPETIKHSAFKHLNPISAVFCVINIEKNRVDCFGESYSLGLKSDVKNDTIQATKQLFGI